MRLPLDYQYRPGEDDDGVTLTVPLEALNQIDPQRIGWLVPGLLREKIEALIRSLPKEYRRLLVPAPDTAAKALAAVRFGEGEIRQTVAAVLSRIAGQPVPSNAFQEERLPPELRMNVRVVDPEGKILAQSRDVQSLRRELGAQAAQSFAALEDPRWTRDGLTTWDLDELPAEVEIQRGRLTMKAYPSLVDRGETVSLRLADSPERAAVQTRGGLGRLFYLVARRKLETHAQWLPDYEKLLLWSATLTYPAENDSVGNALRVVPGSKENNIPRFATERHGGRSLQRNPSTHYDVVPNSTAAVSPGGHAGSAAPFDLRQQLGELIGARAFLVDESLPRTREEFHARRKAGEERIGLAVQEVDAMIGPLLESYHQARLALDEASHPKWRYAVEDVRLQLAELTGPRFLSETPWPWLLQYRRYFLAIVARLKNLVGGGILRDQQKQSEIEPRWLSYLEARRQHREMDLYDPQLDLYRWMLEEYRVSLFAQKLGTAVSVSPKRLDQQWANVRA